MKALVTVLLGTLLLITGCSQFQQQPANNPHQAQAEDWASYQRRMSQSENWQFSGKVGVRKARENNSAGINWQQQGPQYEIVLSGPFNAQAARIAGNNQFITLEADGETWHATTPEALLERQLGWSLPVQELIWWVRGLPAPDSSYQHTMDAERLKTLHQKGWQIRFDRYSAGNRYPEKLRLQYNDLRIILVIHKWDFLSD